MAFNPYAYNPYYQQVQPPVTQPNTGLIWVQGEAGAKSYLVPSNSTALLMDSETDRFYIKTTDASGMPLPLRMFSYSEIGASQNQAQATSPEYITRKEFEAFKASMAEVKHEQPV